MVEFLSSHGAEGQVHPVTGQSPLHAACLAGQAPTTKVILQVRFAVFLMCIYRYRK